MRCLASYSRRKTHYFRQIRASIRFGYDREGPGSPARLGLRPAQVCCCTLRLSQRGRLVAESAEVEGDRYIPVWLHSCEVSVLYAVAPRSVTGAECPWLRKYRPCS